MSVSRSVCNIVGCRKSERCGPLMLNWTKMAIYNFKMGITIKGSSIEMLIGALKTVPECTSKGSFYLNFQEPATEVVLYYVNCIYLPWAV